MIYTEMTKKAMRFAFKAHEGQFDKSGIPYIHHPLHVAEQMTDEDTTVAALLHDVVEDTDYTFQDIADLGFSNKIIEALKLLTHDCKVDYLDYVAALKDNPIARTVKLADLRHNSDLGRLNIISSRDREKYDKYQKAISLLEK